MEVVLELAAESIASKRSTNSAFRPGDWKPFRAKGFLEFRHRHGPVVLRTHGGLSVTDLMNVPPKRQEQRA